MSTMEPDEGVQSGVDDDGAEVPPEERDSDAQEERPAWETPQSESRQERPAWE